MAERQQAMTHQELQKALVAALPESFEVPDTLLEEVRRWWSEALSGEWGVVVEGSGEPRCDAAFAAARSGVGVPTTQ